MERCPVRTSLEGSIDGAQCDLPAGHDGLHPVAYTRIGGRCGEFGWLWKYHDEMEPPL